MDAITQLFDNLVLPILTYGSEAWYPYTKQLEGDPIDQLFKSSTGYKQPHENAHIKFCRQILGVHNKAMKIPALAELGRFPVSLRLVGQVIAFRAYIVTSDADSYTRNIYTDMTEHQSTDKNPWFSFIKNILRGLGMTHVWDNHSTFSADRFLKKKLFWLSYKTDSASSGKKVKKEINQE